MSCQKCGSSREVFIRSEGPTATWRCGDCGFEWLSIMDFVSPRDESDHEVYRVYSQCPTTLSNAEYLKKIRTIVSAVHKTTPAKLLEELKQTNEIFLGEYSHRGALNLAQELQSASIETRIVVIS